ncbi:glycosyl hydrolase [Paraflavisolibacter sp. H34]|uniref:glycosyl hydrolase n=1 Tax=Huijunlia imazamoxiresistens TaxID=3127457 RepID=UPI003016484B
MNRILFLITTLMGVCSLEASAQAPSLPTKGALSETLLSSKSFTNGTQTDTVMHLRPIADNYTLELVGRINAATGRGLDIEARSARLKGFRLSLDASALKWTSALSSASSLSANTAGQDQKIRLAVAGDSVYLYQNGLYLQTFPLAAIKDIAAGVETSNLLNTTKGANLISNWAGGTTTGTLSKPSDFGWQLNPANTTLFATANSTTAGTSRLMDVNTSSGGNLHTLNGATYTGRLLFVRWDNNALASTVYAYPVTLEANTTYDFSMLTGYISNATSGTTLTVGIGTNNTTAGRLSSKTFTNTGTRALKRDNFVFTTGAAGTYYLTVTGPWGLFSIGELALNKVDALPRFIFGKNYPTGSVDLQLSSVTYEEGAYAPAQVETGAKQNVTLTAPVVSVLPTFNTNFVLNGKTDLHLTGETAPLANSSVELNSPDAWLFFDNLRPSVVQADWLDQVTINGMPALNNPNIRLAIYKNGTVLIPNGNTESAHALQVYDQPSLAGDTATYATDAFNNNLGAWNNKIRSFKLRRGYMATLATGADGSGYSRVFIANDEDLVINTMPNGLDTSVSFIRVLKWDWVSKKGKAGWSPAKVGATWYYDWNIGGSAAADYGYAAIRQNGGWPSWNDINNKKNINHVLGFNEPDRPDQANMTVDQCVAQWPDFMKSGFRIGSPAPANPESSWITDFLAKTDALNYRVDFVAIHCYWGGQTPQQWYSRLKNIYNRVKRPLWITEWNNGANWTTETWPADQTAQLEKQLADLKGILQVLDTASFVERYALYDWVENKRALVLADTLTPAGKYYYADKSDFAFNPQTAFVHNWKLVAPTLASSINSDDYFKATLSWKDLNGELGAKYILERKINGRDADFVAVAELSGYTAGGTVTFVDSVFDKATYRVKAQSPGGEVSAYSATLDIVRDAAPAAPASLTGEVVSATRTQLKWPAVTGIRSYNLKRSLNPEGPFETVAARTSLLEFLDEQLAPATTYYYAVTGLNSAGESALSTVLQLATPELVAPTEVKSPRIGSGDAAVTLTWERQYDVVYDIFRSQNAGGGFALLAGGVDAQRYSDSTTANGSTYYYKVEAYNAKGRSAASAVLTALPAAGRHLYIPFDESEGTVAEDVWGGHHATLAATAVRDSGYTRGSLKLDGTATAYAAVQPGALSTLRDFTITTWVKLDALSNWMRIFDFGTGTSKYMFLTPQVSVATGKSTVRYAIKNGGSELSVSYVDSLSLNTWTHFAVSQSGDTARLYINGKLVAANNAVTIRPADLGSTNLNYIGKSQFADPMLKASVDEFKIYNRALTVSELADAMREEQIISFPELTQKRVGDAGFAAGATASSGLELTYSSSNESVATVVNGQVQLKGAGTATITATQAGNATYAPASKEQVLTVLPFHLQVWHKDGDGGKSANNNMRPHLKIVSLDTVPVPFSELTARYWFTPENAGALIMNIDWAKMGAAKVTARYVALAAPLQGATGYAEFSFDTAAGLLKAGANSGDIFGKVYHGNWKNLDELNDYSFAATSAYAANNKITLYRNGQLVWGVEPTEGGTPSAARIGVQEEQLQAEGFSVYPNPAQDVLYIRAGKVEAGAIVEVYNMAGVRVHSARLVNGTQSLSLEGLAAGTYLVQLKNGTTVKTEKIVKQ